MRPFSHIDEAGPRGRACGKNCLCSPIILHLAITVLLSSLLFFQTPYFP